MRNIICGVFFAHFKVDCVYDVGANRGQYRDVLRDNVGYRGIIISFEPVPELGALLQRRKTETHDDTWYIEACALDEVSGTSDFNVMANNVFSSLKPPTTADIDIFSVMNSVQRVVSIRKDTLARQHVLYKERLGFKSPFLKMDTQGNDLAVFRGAGEAIHEMVGLQSELSLRRIYEDAPMYNEAIEYYRASGFELSALVPNNAGHFPDLVEIDCIMYRKQQVSPALGKTSCPSLA